MLASSWAPFPGGFVSQARPSSAAAAGAAHAARAGMAASAAAVRKGYVGMEVTKRPPFVVLAVDDLMDAGGVLQGQPGYANEDVRPGDKLLRVDGTSVEATTVKQLHDLLGGSMHSLVDLAFSRTGGEEYNIRVQRHGLHEHDRRESPRAPAASPRARAPAPASGGAAQSEAAEIGQLRARVGELEAETANLAGRLAQSAAEARAAQQECADVRKQLEDLKSAAAGTAQPAPAASFLSSQSHVLDDLEGKTHSVGEMLQRSRVLLRANQLRLSDMANAEDQLRMDLAKTQNERELLRQQCADLQRDLEVTALQRPIMLRCLPAGPWQLLRKLSPLTTLTVGHDAPYSLSNPFSGGQSVGR